MADYGISGKVAFITGGAGGVGRATSKAFAREGVNVALSDINAESLSEAVRQLKPFGARVVSGVVDITKAEQTEAFEKQVVDELGSIDILVKNAGAVKMQDLLALPEAEFRRNTDLMLFSTVRLIKEIGPRLRDQGWGRIVNVSSIFGKQPGGILDYDTLKAAIIMVTKDFSNYFAADGVNVNAVAPGPVSTPMWYAPGQLGDQLARLMNTDRNSAIAQYAKQNIPLGRYAKPEEIADLIVFLSSERASYITGQTVSVDGGMGKGLA